jgi:thioredoxin-like negative regulator of GroEL
MLAPYFRAGDAAHLQTQAEAAAHGGNWPRALALWRQVNATPSATGATYLGESRACLAQGLAGQAERALRKASAAAPAETEAWLLLLEILRVEDRPIEAFRVGWEGVDRVPRASRTELLSELTLIALTDLPDEVARATLERWIAADPSDINARVAYLQRIGTEPRSADPDRTTRLAELSALLAEHPEHIGLREAMVTALADAGEPDRGRLLLEIWPAEQRDGRYWRLRGRWDLEHDHHPDEAVTALRAALVDFPQDWRTHYRLARALQIVNRPEEARRESEAVSRIRELLDPLTLGPKLDASFAHLDDPTALEALADLCARAGLTHLADTWRASEPRKASTSELFGAVPRQPAG